MTDGRVREALEALVTERDWGQFHSAGNLIKSIAIEAGELLESVQWGEEPDVLRVRDELADVLTYSYLLAAKLGLDPDQIVLEKLELTKDKYPVEKSRGRSTKHDQLHD